jgi:hypothetical protein
MVSWVLTWSLMKLRSLGVKGLVSCFPKAYIHGSVKSSRIHSN